jgi:glutathione S-transferase
VKPALFLSTSVAHRVIGGLMWPVTRKIMMSMYDVCPGAAAESQAKLEAELDWLDRRLADGRPYLVGDRLSRADIAVASLLAPLARPKEMPIYSPLDAIDAFTALAERWKERRTIGWINLLYAVHRGSTRPAEVGSAV